MIAGITGKKLLKLEEEIDLKYSGCRTSVGDWRDLEGEGGLVVDIYYGLLGAIKRTWNIQELIPMFFTLNHADNGYLTNFFF